jgi:hypothetical protein
MWRERTPLRPKANVGGTTRGNIDVGLEDVVV